jgi:predicted GH43/DUF377 family glycosyl hydrolase
MKNNVTHNLGLAAEFFKRRGIESLFPPAHLQLPHLPVNRMAIKPGGYNPSILRWGERTLMAYRYHADTTPHTKISIAELDQNLMVFRDRTCEASGNSVEDGRLFLFGGHPWISYTVSQGPVGAWKCVVRYGRLVERTGGWAVEGQHLLPYGSNDSTSMEKNWVFFEWEGRLFCIYKSGVVLEIENNSVAKVHASDPVRWMWGDMRGGSIAGVHGDHLVRFFHSRLDNEPRPTPWRYFVGAALMENKPPFSVVKVSKRPILFGSEVDSIAGEERRKIHHWKPSVVFPCGAISDGEDWIVSVGVNDASCILSKVAQKDLNL